MAIPSVKGDVVAARGSPRSAPLSRAELEHAGELLKAKHPGKAVFTTNTGGFQELVGEVDPPSLHADYSDAEAWIWNSQPHKHEHGTEVYRVLEGSLEVMLDGVPHVLNNGDELTISPGTVHSARSLRPGPAKVLAHSEPGFDPSDYHPA